MMDVAFREELETERLRLKILREDNAEVYLALVAKNRERLQESFQVTVSKVSDIKSTKAFLKKAYNELRYGKLALYGLWYKGALAGMVTIKDISWQVPKCEVSYFVAEEYEGQGLASEALKKVCFYCFSELKILKICARIIPDNSRSIRLVQKLGFELEGTLKADYKTGLGDLIDTKYYGLVNEAALAKYKSLDTTQNNASLF
ncbi:GNAT family N-acetyltransferase [Pontibacter silvestris]|uniref:GNAT family N-acetyltransferase n=1 Tax=Pontibacter silvestris TaxID=2305183 RepID=A0ABW4X565_9BACT|nr:GNAT family protein [Pontibacter silvestris]MCC9137147.1 GNAT family N-acetyltransferase [Pontibacter silvestris]